MTNSISFADTKVTDNRLVIERAGTTFTFRWRNYCAWDEAVSHTLSREVVGTMLESLWHTGWWSTQLGETEVSVSPWDTGGTTSIQYWNPAQYDSPIIARVSSGDTSKLISWLKGQYDACGRTAK